MRIAIYFSRDLVIVANIIEIPFDFPNEQIIDDIVRQIISLKGLVKHASRYFSVLNVCFPHINFKRVEIIRNFLIKIGENQGWSAFNSEKELGNIAQQISAEYESMNLIKEVMDQKEGEFFMKMKEKRSLLLLNDIVVEKEKGTEKEAVVAQES